MSHLKHLRGIGCHMYVMISTKGDIAYDVGKISIYTSNPISHNWQTINRIFKYLKGTMYYGLTYSGIPLIIESYSDEN